MSDVEEQLNEWLNRLSGPRSRGRADRDLALAEMREFGTEAIFSRLIPLLEDADLDVRCKAIEAIFLLDPSQSFPVLISLLDDKEDIVRWYVCGYLHDIADDRAVQPLIEILRKDPDPQVRGTAAYALGGIASPKAIPALIAAMESDHESDMHGHSASSCAASALDDILGTSETRIRVSADICKLVPWHPNLPALKQQAEKVYAEWSAQQSKG